MGNLRKKFVTAAVVLAFLLIFVGCGNNDSPDLIIPVTESQPIPETENISPQTQPNSADDNNAETPTNTIPSPYPPLSLNPQTRMQTIAAGAMYSLVITDDGILWSWGWGADGRLGDGGTADRHVPAPVLDDATSVAVNWLGAIASNLVIRTDNSLWTWGGQARTPQWLKDDVIAFSNSFMIIKSDNSLWGTGGNIPSYAVTENINMQNPVWIMDDVVAVSDLGTITFALQSCGSLWAWGENTLGGLGDGTRENRDAPVLIMSDVASVFAGVGSVMVIRTDGSLWGWGFNHRGSVGDGTTIQRIAPVWIMDNVVAVSSCFSTEAATMAIRSDGSLWAWGGNDSGNLGDGTTVDRHSPVWIMDNVVAVSQGGGHAMAVQSDGSLWAWGLNNRGQLGDGTAINRHNPVRVKENIMIPNN